MTPKLASGLVLGKFMPPHAGHLYLLEFARNLVNELTIILDPADSTISIAQRREWLEELVPGIRIVTLSRAIADEGSESISDDVVMEILQQFDLCPSIIFGANEPSLEFAAKVGATYVPIDKTIVPVNSEDILRAPLQYWERIPRCVRPQFVKRVCVFGPESTGKSTLAKNLAKHFGTVFVPEYARVFLESRHNNLELDEFKFYARGQIASEDALARSANRVLFCDTDALTTLMWSDWLFQHRDAWIEALASLRQYDLYLLADVDVPWVADDQRYFPEERRKFFDYCAQQLRAYGRDFVVVKGDWEQRFNTAKDAVEQVLGRRATVPSVALK